VVPTLLSGEEVEEIARFIAGASKFVLQQFEPKLAWDQALRLVSPFSKEEMEEMAKACRKFVPNTILRGT
jgi:pyruvate-formate lyase-activating enzyme